MTTTANLPTKPGSATATPPTAEDMTGIEYRIYGPPGCGKTTYLGRQVQAALNKNLKPLVLSLTRAAALEIADRSLPLAEDEVGTLHAYCWKQLGRPVLAEDDKRIKEWNEAHPDLALSPSRSRTVDHDNLDYGGGQHPGDRAIALYQLRRSRLEPTDFKNPFFDRFARTWEAWKRGKDLLDFNDLIDRALADYPAAPTKPQAIFADEAQDLDYQQMALLRRWGKAAGRLVVIGDPDQNLYRWRGSEPECFNRPALPPEQIRVLNHSYRVPRAVHRLAWAWINRCPGRYNAEYHPREAPGELRQLFLGDRIYGNPHDGLQDSWQQADRLLADMQRYLRRDQSVMILAPCSYMLDPIIDRLKLEALPFHNPRRDNNGRWNPIQRNIPGKTTAVDRLEAWLALSERGYWTAAQVAQWAKALRERDSETKELILPGPGRRKKDLLALTDNGGDGLDPETLERMLSPQALEAGYSGDLDWFRNQLLAGERPQVYEYPISVIKARGLETLLNMPKITIGTIHSVKGTEADVVYLFPDLSVPGRAEWNGNPEAQAGVYRLFYVAMTRARESLIICRPAPADR